MELLNCTSNSYKPPVSISVISECHVKMVSFGGKPGVKYKPSRTEESRGWLCL